MEKTNDLVDFMNTLTREMGDEYNRIQKRSTEDQGTAGDQGEENWATIFKNWLPPDYHVVTKGRLLSEKGTASPQVDVIILHPFYPKHLLDKKLYLTAGVAAVFECKNTLKSSHIEKTIQNSIEIRNLINVEPSNYLKELYSPIIYGLVAHSHSWKNDKSDPINNIQSKLLETDNKFTKHPRECLDFICVSDLATWSAYKQPMSLSRFNRNGKIVIDWIDGVQTAYGCSSKNRFAEGTTAKLNFTPIGSFLSRLLNKLALNDKRLNSFSQYFRQAIGDGCSLNWRDWSDNILSDIAKQDLKINRSKYEGSQFLNEG